MDAAEKSLLIKLIEGLTITDKVEEKKQIEALEYIKAPNEYVEKLENRRTSIKDRKHLKEGNIIIWKEGLKNKRLPNYDQPAIVLKRIDPPNINKDDSFSEELDIQIGFITDDDEFLVFNYDSSRFQLFTK